MMEQLAAINTHLPLIAGLFITVFIAAIAAVLTKKLLLTLLHVLIANTHSTWDDALVKHNVFGRLSQIVPAVFIYLSIDLVPNLPDTLDTIIRNVAAGWVVLTLVRVVNSILASINTLYEATADARSRPIKGFIELAQIAASVIGFILVVAALIDESPLILLSGLGAMTAVSMLIFQDTLLSLVASIQLTNQQIIRIGDWIEMPSFNADGTVIDIALYNVTIQNWDNTVTTVPTNKLVSGAFRNWRGMSESGGRRIKRGIYLDINSVRLLTDEEATHFKRFALLKDYIAEKEAELQAYNEVLGAPHEAGVNLRKLTNIGTFRAYIYNYLKKHPKIHNDMTLIVRQLQSGPDGLPIEIYCFTNDTNWFNYEGIQSDIFDHLFAIAPEFGLQMYQSPTGLDFRGLTGKN